MSAALNSGGRFRQTGRSAKEIMVPKIEVTGFGDYTRNEGYKTGGIDFSYETKTNNYDRGICLLADVMDMERLGSWTASCSRARSCSARRSPVGRHFRFLLIASHTGVTTEDKDCGSATAEDVLADLRAATSARDEGLVSNGSRILFITPTLKGVLDDYSYANPNRSDRVMERFSRIVEVSQVRFCTAITLNLGDSDQFGYAKASAAARSVSWSSKKAP